ncbi:MAG: hypothetical protein SFV81_14540 [Pirellulaceae bacterium]|nr:hypothetical protein [Pirellulaceae bacterium]
MTRDEALAAFECAGVPPLPAFLDFQTKFGGYAPDLDVTYGVVGLKDHSGEPRWSQEENLQFVRCDLENITQVRMSLDETGVFYHDGTPVAESFESFIAYSAYSAQTLTPLGWKYIDDERRSTKRFKEFLSNLEQATVVRRATDRYHSVCQSGQYFKVVIGNYQALFVRPDLLKGW